MDTTGIPKPYFSVPPKCRFHLGFGLGVTDKRIRKVKDYQFIASGTSSQSDLTPISERHDEALAQDFTR